MKQLLAFLGAGLKVSGGKTKFIGDVSQTVSHCFLHTKLLLHWVILLVANPYNLGKDVQCLILSRPSQNGELIHVLDKMYPAHNLAKIINFFENVVKGKFTANLSTPQPEGKFYRKGKTFDINLCRCQHLVTVLVKVKSDLERSLNISMSLKSWK